MVGYEYWFKGKSFGNSAKNFVKAVFEDYPFIEEQYNDAPEFKRNNVENKVLWFTFAHKLKRHHSEGRLGIDLALAITPIDDGNSLRKQRAEIEDQEKWLAQQGVEGKERDTLVRSRVNQGVFRDRLLEVYGGQCCITGLRNEELLIASHIKPWSESEDNEKLIPENGLLLNALHDKAFDRGLITFTDDYRLKVNEELSSSQNGRLYEMLLRDEGKPIKSPTGFKPDRKYLQWHRRKHGFEK